MSKVEFYILTVDVTQEYSTEELKTQLNLCLDWLRIVPGVYLLRSSSALGVLYQRFHKILQNNRFFIAPINIENDKFVGRLQTAKWDWIKKYLNTPQ